MKFDGQGVQTDTFDEITEELETGYKSIYGTDIVIAQDTPDGQRIGIESTLRYDVQSVVAWLYSQLDPDLNNGDMQQVIGKLAGVTLLPASRSSWDIVINVTRDITLPINYTIADDNGTEWFLDSGVDLSTGDNTVTFLAVEWGDVAGVSSATFTQSTPELYVSSIAALVDAVAGREEETEEAFRLRRQASTENPAQSTIGAIYAKLAGTNGVIDLAVYDNGTNTDDVLTGSSNSQLVGSSEAVDLDAHTMWAVIEGGSLDDIGEIMAKQRLGNTKGDVQVTYNDTLTRPDGTTITIINEHNIDRPTYVDLHIRLNAELTKSGEVIDVDTIKETLATHSFYIGGYIQAAILSKEAYIDNYNYVVTDFEISLDGSTWTDGRLFSGFDGKFTIDVANIDVTEV